MRQRQAGRACDNRLQNLRNNTHDPARNPRHARPALCERPALHIGHLLGYIQCGHLGACATHGGRHGAFRRHRRRAWHAHHAGRGKSRHVGGRIHQGHADQPRGGFPATSACDHDYYYTTHSPENRELAEYVYLAPARERTRSRQRKVSQFYDPVKSMFLPDRYIKGECPACGTPDQYGDNCENCGSTYAPTDLKNPHSVVVRRQARDARLGTLFFRGRKIRELPARVARTRTAARIPRSRPNSRSGWIRKAACATGTFRAMRPYFGFEIPGTQGQNEILSTSGWMRRLATWPASRNTAASERGRANGLSPGHFPSLSMRTDDPDIHRRSRTAPLPRQGHRQFPRPVLAGDAARAPPFKANRLPCT